MLHACFVRSPFARARIDGIDASEALALPGVRAVFVAADLNPDVREQWYTLTGPNVAGHAAAAAGRGRGALRRRPGRARRRRRPLHRRGRGRARGRRLRAAARRRRLRRRRVDADELVHEALPGNVAGELAGAPPETLDEVFASAAHVVERDDLPAGVRRGADGDARARRRVVAASGELTIWAATQAPHEVRAFVLAPARPPGAPHPGRSCATPAAASARRSSRSARTCASCWRPARCRAAIKWIEDRRENLMSAGQSRHEHGAVAHGVRRRRHDPRRAASTTCRTSARTRRRGRSARAAAVGMLFPGPYRVPRATFSTTSVFTNTVRPHRVPRAVAVRVGRARGAARHRRAPDRASTRSSSAAATCCASDELPYANPNGMPYDHISPLGDVRAGARDARLRGVPARAGATRARPAATSGSARAPTSSPRRPRHGRTTAPRARRSASSRRAR